MTLTNWNDMIRVEAGIHGDPLEDFVVYPERVMWPRKPFSTEPAEGATGQFTLFVEFDDGYGTHEGPAFTAWSAKRVYFPVEYDGSEYVASAPRNPDPSEEHRHR